MCNKKVCVSIYLRILHETTILAVFWWLNLFLQRLAISCKTHCVFRISENVTWA